MKRPQLYLETSVWNFYFADDAPEKREITLRFFDKVKQDEYEIFTKTAISKATLMSFPPVGNLSEKTRRIADKPQ